MKQTKKIYLKLNKLFLAFCLIVISLMAGFSGFFQINFSSSLHMVQAIAEEGETANSESQNNQNPAQVENDNTESVEGVQALNQSNNESTPSGIDVSNLQTFASCNFTDANGMDAVIDCLRSILTFIAIISIIIGFFRIVFVAIGAFIPGVSASQNPLIQFKERLLDFLIGIPFMGASILLLFLLNPAATNIGFLNLSGLDAFIPQSPENSNNARTGSITGSDNSSSNFNNNSNNSSNSSDSSNSNGQMQTLNNSSLASGLTTSCFASTNNTNQYNCTFQLQDNYVFPSSGTFQAGISTNTGGTNPVSPVNCNYNNTLVCNNIPAGNNSSLEGNNVLLRLGTGRSYTPMSSLTSNSTGSYTTPNQNNSTDGGGSNNEGTSSSTSGSTSGVGNIFNPDIDSGSTGTVFGPWPNLSHIQTREFFVADNLFTLKDLNGRDIPNPSGTGSYYCQSLTFNYAMFNANIPGLYILDDNNQISTRNARITVCDNPDLPNYYGHFQPLVERDGQAFQIAPLTHIEKDRFQIGQIDQSIYNLEPDILIDDIN